MKLRQMFSIVVAVASVGLWWTNNLTDAIWVGVIAVWLKK